MASRRIEDALQVLRSEYVDAPGLVLTPADVAGHFTLDRPTAAALLRAMEHSHFLRRTPDGGFALARHPAGDTES